MPPPRARPRPPKLDGVGVLTRLRAAGAGLPVLVLTARDRLADKASAFRAGADDYLVKPYHDGGTDSSGFRRR